MKEYALLKANDPELYEAVMAETTRQRNKIELIASENFVSEVVMEANGTTLTNKYAEGYPGNLFSSSHIHLASLKKFFITASFLYSRRGRPKEHPRVKYYS